MSNAYTNHNDRRYHTSRDCRLCKTHMVVEDKHELDRRGYQMCTYCRQRERGGHTYTSDMLNNSQPEDIGLSKMGERHV